MSISINLHHQFPELTLDVGFDAPAGVTALFGASGSGKTTVVNAVAGLLKPDRGRISVAGTALLDTSAGLRLPPGPARDRCLPTSTAAPGARPATTGAAARG